MGNGRRCADYCGCHLLRHADSRVKEGCAIFEDTIRSQLEGISATVNSMGQNSGLLSSLTDWNSTLAGYADSISTGVVMPVALTLLALFMILELYNATQRIAMNGSNNAFTIQQIALVMLKIVVCRWAVVHTTEILNALFEVASTVTVGISGYVGSGEVNTTVDIENAIAALPGGIGNMPVVCLQCDGIAVHSHTLLSGAARYCSELPQILPRGCLAGRGAVSGYWLLSSTGRFAGHRWQHHGASVGNAGAVGDPAGGSVYERKVHESHYQCNDLIPFGD